MEEEEEEEEVVVGTYLFSHATQLVPSSHALFLKGGGKLRRMKKMLFNPLETMKESQNTHTHTHTHIGLLLF
jgi:hypothetical protein